MSARQRLTAGIVGLALVGAYSWIMTATAGSASWAWLLLVAALVVLASTARSVAAVRSERRGA